MQLIMKSTMVSLCVLLALAPNPAAAAARKLAATHDDDLARPALTFYLFEQFVSVPGAEATNIVSASPSGNASAYAFGNFGVSQQIIRESASNTSAVIGRAPGWFSANKENGVFNLQKSLTLLAGKHKGTLIVFSDFDSSQPTNEFAVVGGTGSFRLAEGWATTSIVSAGLDHLTYRWDVFLNDFIDEHHD